MNQKHKAVLACVVAFGCGVGVGHILTKLHLEKDFEEQLAEEAMALKRHYRKLHKEEEYATPEGARKAFEEERDEEPMPEEAREALIRYSGKTVPGVVEPSDRPRKKDVTTADIYQEYHKKRRQEAEVIEDQDPTSDLDKPIVRQNIFSPDHPALAQPEFVPDAEARKSEKPYIMTFDEYNEDRQFDEAEVVYYTGDKTVADDKDEPIEEGLVDEMFGWDNLLEFGDKFVIYICNPKLGLKFEVTRTDGSFAQMVAGFNHVDDIPEGDSG